MTTTRAAVLLLLASGCANGDAADAPPLDAIEDLRIGSIDDAATALTRVAAITVGPDGRIYVAQPMDPSIRVFAPDGTPSGRIGRGGSGPGEFGYVGPMGWRGDTLYAPDFRQRRVNLFDAEGDPRGEISMVGAAAPDNRYLIPGVPFPLLEDGTAIMRYSMPSSAVADGSIETAPVVRIDRTGAVLDTLYEQRPGTDQFSITYGQGRGRGMLFGIQPYQRATILAMSDDGRFLYLVDRAPSSAEPPTFRVLRILATGDTLWSRPVAYAAVPMTPERRDSAIAAQLESLSFLSERQGLSEGEVRGLVEDAIRLPDHVPPVSHAVVAADGVLWLRTVREPEPLWLRLSPDGEPAGTVRLPSDISILWARGDTVYGTVRDELDVSYVVRYTIPNP